MFRIYENNNWKEDHQDYHKSEEQNQEDHHNHLQLTLEPRGLKITNFTKIKYVHNSIIQKGQILEAFTSNKASMWKQNLEHSCWDCKHDLI